MDPLLKTKEIYSVIELNNAVKGILNREFPDAIWVYGEIQGYNRNKRKKHIFFELCEKHPEIDEIIAKVTVVIFERTKEKLVRILKQTENSFELQDDIEVKLLCKVDLYPRSGEFMLIVESIDPVYTLGKFAQNRQKIIAELKAKGILNKNKMLTIPRVPLNIGLITSFNSAAYHDFTDELRKSEFGFKIYYLDSFMQGKNVEQDVCNALGLFNEYEFLDIVVITRGGGSTADLSWFDSKGIAEKIAFSRVPVLSGIGHEINITITDIASHTFMKTPTAIAQFVINRVKEFLEEADEKIESIITLTDGILRKVNQELEHLATEVESETYRFLSIHKENFAGTISSVQLSTHNFIRNSKAELYRNSKELSMQTTFYLRNVKKDIIRAEKDFEFARFHRIFRDYRKYLFEKYEGLKKFSGDIIKHALINTKHYEDAVKILDPMSTIKRGFSITKTKGGMIVRSIKNVRKNDGLTTIVSDGEIESKIESMRKE